MAAKRNSFKQLLTFLKPILIPPYVKASGHRFMGQQKGFSVVPGKMGKKIHFYRNLKEKTGGLWFLPNMGFSCRDCRKS